MSGHKDVNPFKSVDLGERARRAREHKVRDLGERARPILFLIPFCVYVIHAEELSGHTPTSTAHQICRYKIHNDPQRTGI